MTNKFSKLRNKILDILHHPRQDPQATAILFAAAVSLLGILLTAIFSFSPQTLSVLNPFFANIIPPANVILLEPEKGTIASPMTVGNDSNASGGKYITTSVAASSPPSPPVTSKNLYVSPSGNDSNDGSSAHPFASVNKAATLATADTTVHVAPGTYSQPVTVSVSGTPTAPIIFLSDTKWAAKIVANGAVFAAWRTTGNYIYVENFDITAPDTTLGLSNEGSFNKVIGNNVHDVGTVGACQHGGGAIDSWSGSYSNHDADIIGNVVTRSGIPSCLSQGYFIHGIYVAHQNAHVSNNIVSNAAGYGLHCWHACTSLTMTNNVVFNNLQGGIIAGAGDAPGGVVYDNSIIANNISINNTGYGIREYGYDSTTIGANNRYLNNNVYGNSGGGFLFTGNMHTDSGTIASDAQFVNYQADGSGDYHLNASSPDIDHGTATGAPATDFDNNSRPQGPGFDIGAYEYTSGPSLPGNTGNAALTFNIANSGTYYVWARLLAADANSDSFWLQADSGNGIKVGDGNVPFGQWAWVNYQNGNPSQRISLSLSSGSHALKLIGREANIKIDALVISPDPSFNPDNPQIFDSTPPTVAINSPVNGASLTGNVPVSVNAADDGGIAKVELLVDWAVVQTKTVETNNTYAFNLSSAAFTNGSHTLMARATDLFGNVGTSSILNITFNNSTPSPAPPPPSSKTGDLNGDGKVDILDLSILLRNWNAAGNNAADLNNDAKVDILDLSILLRNWGS